MTDHPRITLIHATPVAVEPVMDAFRRLWPEVGVYNILEDSLAPDLERAGELDDSMIDRFRRLAKYAADCGSDGILFTCSAFGAAIEAAAADLAPLPVLKPNEAMFEDALRVGDRIGMVATFQPAVGSMAQEFEDLAAAAKSRARLFTVCVPDAMAALRAGDAEAHNRIVAAAAADFRDCDAILLAHFSTAQARDAVGEVVAVPILSSPYSAVRKLRGS